MKKSYSLGLDIGIGSVGWAIVDLNENIEPTRIIDLGVHLFSAGEDKSGQSFNLERREKRGSRRVIRRKKHRLERIRKLFYDYKMIKSDSFDFSILQEKSNEIINNYYKNNKENPFTLKVKALDEKLTNEELMIILFHYAKYRGYLSNREENDPNQDVEGKAVLSNISKNKKRLEQYRTVSEMFLKEPDFQTRIHNEPNNYKMSISRDMYFDEINKVLDQQILFSTIDTQFKERYLDIWAKQRHYAEGPGSYITTSKKTGKKITVRSPYGGNLIQKMTGTCQFDGLPRAPKHAVSSELFRVVQSLVNFRYVEADASGYKALTQEEIDIVLDVLKKQEKVTYKKLNQVLNKNIRSFRYGSNTKKEKDKALEKFKKEYQIKEDLETIIIKDFSEEEKENFDKILVNEVMSRTFLTMPTYHILKKAFTNKHNVEEWEAIKDNHPMFDEIITILTDFKTNDDIVKAIENSKNIDKKYTETILSLPNFKDHIHLSIDLASKLIPLLKTEGSYDKAMGKLNYNFTNSNTDVKKGDTLPPIPVDDIKNQRVLRSLSQSRKLINAIIRKYGLPSRIQIEVARDLAKTKDERRKIEKNQLYHQEKNQKLKQLLVNTFPQYFKTPNDVKPFDIQKYNLWNEQGEICPYSLEKITIEELFNNDVQVDHILPYSRTYNDHISNKTLVKIKQNQEKGNRTPYEWLKDTNTWSKYESFINSTATIPYSKKINYLYKDLSEEKENEFKNQNLNDTKYIAKYLLNFVKIYLDVNSVVSVKGGITDKLKSRWGLTYTTHSLERQGYYLSKEEGVKKNRGNHLHHILDACIIAVTTPSLIKRVTAYEKLKRYLNSKLVQKDIDKVYEKITYYNKETGELITEHDFNQSVNTEELNDYIREEIKNRSIIKGKHKYYMNYPLPYKDFKQEVLLRIFEQNPIILQRDLGFLDNYKTETIHNILPIMPHHEKDKIGGKLHKETYYGIREAHDMYEVKKIETERIAVNASRLKRETLDKIIDRGTGAKATYDTLVKWLGNFQTGDQAFQKQGYPINIKSGQPIKKILLKKADFTNNGHLLAPKKKVEAGFVLKIIIYKSIDPTDKKLYYTGLDYMKIMKIRNFKTDNLLLTLWNGQKIKDQLEYNKISDHYIEVDTLYKKDFIKITLKNSNFGYCYITGFRKGQLEFFSPLGDGYDLFGESGISKPRIGDRYDITVSQIEKIEKINISILGKIQN